MHASPLTITSLSVYIVSNFAKSNYYKKNQRYYKRLSFIKKKIFKVISNIKSHINYLVRYILNKMAETINFKTEPQS